MTSKTQRILVCCCLLIALTVGSTAYAQTSSDRALYAVNKKAWHNTSSATEYEQSGRNKNEEKLSVLQVLNQLNKTKGVYFLVADKSLQNIKVFPVKNMQDDAESILTELLKGTSLTYKKIDEKTYVIIRAREKADSLNEVSGYYSISNTQYAYEARSPQQKITGKVTNTSGDPLVSVSIVVQGKSKGTNTDSKGVYSIDASKGDVLVFSFVGFATKQITLGDETELNVVLSESQTNLSDVVVTALGIQKQARSLGYSTTEVDGSKFTQAREVNIGNALTGQIAGVSVAGVSTGPYGSSRVIIRGNASLTGNNQPLYVIDGIPYDNKNQGSAGMWGGADYGDGLSNINPDDIETMQVLKGVAATALYGYRGGNGAILITTKSGARSKGIGVEVNNNFTLSKIFDTRDIQYVYGQGTQGVKPVDINAANATAESAWGAKIDGSDAVNFLGDTYKYNAYKDNYKNFYQTGLTNQTSVALLGGNDKGHFRLGLSNLYLNTNVPNSNMKQQGVNFNSTYNVTPKLQMTLTANYIFEQVKNRGSLSDAPGNYVASLNFLANTFDVRWLSPRVDANKNELLPGSQDIYFENPYFIAYDFENQTNRNRLTGGLTIKYNILDWLYLQGQVTRDGYNFDTRSVTPNGVQYSNAGGGSINMSNINQRELDWHGMIGVNKKINENFTINANVGVYSQDNQWKSYSGGGGPFNVPFFYSISNVTSRPFNYGFTHSRVNSVYGNVDVGYKNFLFITATARNDWFSMLNPASNHYLYPSISGSFVFSDAFHMPDWISFGKLRASYAQSSNTGAATPYQTVLTYGLQGYSIGGQPVGYVVNGSIPNQNLRPVKIREDEIGLNMQFFKSRVGFDVAVYNKKTEDDIVPVTVSSTSGYNSNTINIGKLENKGVEVLITGTPVKTKNFSWNVSFNYAYNNSKVLDLGGVPSLSLDVPRFGDGVSISNVVGMSYGQIMGFKYKRDDKGSIIYDTSGLPLRSDGIVSLGSGVYKQTGGLTNEFHFKDFVFSFLIDYKFGANIYSGTNLVLYSEGLQKNTLAGREGGYVGPGVTEDGKPNTKAVRSETYFNAIAGGANSISEEFVYNAGFIKLRSMTLGYVFPKSILKDGFIKGLSLTLVARNLATLLKHTPNIDPESNYNNTNAQGLELSGYPPVRSLGLNLNIKF
ncbi:SusC/RagA family TonB-linked outer membrane protein [Danxiaibacter flavus]|uniref:SusC/RagA family TonB-linked outer membrane protein n=1 Tax=Danxiaibacter flavus TaxID=3049108 RepID=A0ABV3ZBT2_9BACT|nr:SusC/RagA family TonB-linked outer membrane protein [Chitinophagaceae bacterium DXS]